MTTWLLDVTLFLWLWQVPKVSANLLLCVNAPSRLEPYERKEANLWLFLGLLIAMAPKQKGSGAPKRGNATEEVEETLQAVVRYVSCPIVREEGSAITRGMRLVLLGELS